jgi:hypothetical protein
MNEVERLPGDLYSTVPALTEQFRWTTLLCSVGAIFMPNQAPSISLRMRTDIRTNGPAKRRKQN